MVPFLIQRERYLYLTPLPSIVILISLVFSFPLQSKANSHQHKSLAKLEKHSHSQKELPPLLQEIEDKYKKYSTISAEFTQINDNSSLKTKKSSSGRVFIKRPLKIRWEVLQPSSSTLVSNGVKYWFYTPPFDEGEKGQLIEKKASQIQSQLADSLLAGSLSSHRYLQIKQQSNASFLLIPKKGTAGAVKKVILEINQDQKLIQKVILNYQGGNQTEITLSKIEFGKPLEDNLFDFTPPPNTDIINE